MSCLDSETKDYLTYEEVALYYPQPNRKRPIVLIGPKDVGRQELRQRLMKSDLDRFAAAVPRKLMNIFRINEERLNGFSTC